MLFIRYFGNVLRIAFSKAWAITEAAAGGIAILGGIIGWIFPKWESPMKNLIWMIPLGIFVFLLILRVLIIAPYKMYRGKQLIFAIPDELIPSLLQNMNIRIGDLTREEVVIRNKTFDNCHIYGPAVIVLNHLVFSKSQFAEVTPECIFIETTNKVVAGVIVLDTCVVKNCTFHKISILGTPEEIKRYKEKFINKKKE